MLAASKVIQMKIKFGNVKNYSYICTKKQTQIRI